MVWKFSDDLKSFQMAWSIFIIFIDIIVDIVVIFIDTIVVIAIIFIDIIVVIIVVIIVAIIVIVVIAIMSNTSGRGRPLDSNVCSRFLPTHFPILHRWASPSSC